MAVTRYGLAIVALLLGCSSPPELMPLRIGASTTYRVIYGLEAFVEPVTVSREVPVMGLTGYELSGPMGVSRLVWKGGVLYAAQVSNARFDPPIPLLSEDLKTLQWRGTLESLETKAKATAELKQAKEKLQMSAAKLDTVKTVLAVTLPRGRIELTTWFRAGMGIVRQEQHTGGELVLRLEATTPR